MYINTMILKLDEQVFWKTMTPSRVYGLLRKHMETKKPQQKNNGLFSYLSGGG